MNATLSHTKSSYFYQNDYIKTQLEPIDQEESDSKLAINSQISTDNNNVTPNNMRLSISLSRVSSGAGQTYNMSENSYSFIQELSESHNLRTNCPTDEDIHSIFMSFEQSNLRGPELIAEVADTLKQHPIDEIQSIDLDFQNCVLGDINLNLLCNKYLSKFTNIHSLRLILLNNNITDTGLVSLLAYVNSLTNLNQLELDLSFNELNGSVETASIVERFQILLGCCSSSKQIVTDYSKQMITCPGLNKLSLNFESNNLSEKGIRNIINGIQMAPNLREISLNIKKTQLKKTSLQLLNRCLSQARNCKILSFNIGNNRIEKEVVLSTIDALLQSPQLDHLTIDLQGSILQEHHTFENKNTKKTIPQPQEGRMFSGRVFELRLGWNQLDNNTLIEIANKIKFSNSLTSFSVDLQFNQFGTQGLSSIIDRIQHCGNIKTLNLNLQHNRIGDKTLLDIGDYIERLKRLYTFSLNMGFTDLQLEAITNFSLSVQKCIQIKNLSLNLCQSNLSDPAYEKTTRKILRCSSTVELRVAFNSRPSDFLKPHKFKNSLRTMSPKLRQKNQ